MSWFTNKVQMEADTMEAFYSFLAEEDNNILAICSSVLSPWMKITQFIY